MGSEGPPGGGPTGGGAAPSPAGAAGTGSVGRVTLIALFVTALVTAQLTASKLLLFGLPVALPITGDSIVLPGAALAYAVTFFASDCYAELFGRRDATVMVNVAFAMNLVLLALVYATIWAPALPGQPVAPETYANVLGQSTSIVVGSMAAYLVSQNWDVYVFHAVRERTDGEALWLRNLASTASSQLLDTVIFVGLAFWLVPQLLGGRVTPLETVASLIVGQYLLKLLIALVDTPFVYAVVAAVRRRDAGRTPSPERA